jgi:hypothetical protein
MCVVRMGYSLEGENLVELLPVAMDIVSIGCRQDQNSIKLFFY